MTKELIIAEDSPRDAEYVAQLLPGYTPHFASSGAEALQLALRSEAPWLVSDIQMPGMDGIELARQLWRERPAARIVFWTQFNDEMYVRALAKVIPAETVYGYVLKNNRSEVIRRALLAVFEETQCWIDPKVRPVQARLHQHAEALTDIEFDTLIDLALGLTDAAIAERHYLSRRGAQNRLQSLYAKLGVDRELSTGAGVDLINPRVRAVTMALRRGLINAHLIEEEEHKLTEWLAQRAD